MTAGTAKTATGTARFSLDGLEGVAHAKSPRGRTASFGFLPSQREEIAGWTGLESASPEAKSPFNADLVDWHLSRT